MIQLAHAATGALAGRRRAGILDALLAGVAIHAVMDVAPHKELHDDRFEARSAILSIALLTARFGPLNPVLWSAIGSTLPDVEHVLPRRIRPKRPLFPTHRFTWLHGWEHKPLALPTWLQVIASGAILGALAANARQRTTL